MEPAVRFAVNAVLLLGMVIAAVLYSLTLNEVDSLRDKQKRLEADVRHFKGIAWKAQDFENQAVHAAQMETMQVYQQMQAQLDACRKGKP